MIISIYAEKTFLKNSTPTIHNKKKKSQQTRNHMECPQTNNKQQKKPISYLMKKKIVFPWDQE